MFRNFIRLITTQDVDNLRGRAVFTGGKTNETYELSWLSPKGDVRAVNTVEVDTNAVIAELEGLTKVEFKVEICVVLFLLIEFNNQIRKSMGL